MHNMTIQEIEKELRKPFDFAHLGWKPQITSKENVQVMVTPYLDSRAIQNRLDDVVGIYNWKNEFMLWQPNSQVCGILLWDQQTGQWIGKYDGAENSDYEPIKGGLSDSFKRAAVMWGMGRYLYDMEPIWVKAYVKKSGGKDVYTIANDQYGVLRNHYNKSLQEMNLEIPTAPARTANQMPYQPPQQSNNSAPTQNSGKQANSQTTQDNSMQPEYFIKSARIDNDYTLLILLDKSRKEITAYTQTQDKQLKAGAFLANVKGNFETNDSIGKYLIIESYSIIHENTQKAA